MPKPQVTATDLRARRKRQEEWREFRKQALFSQRKLAEVLEVSIRTIQNIESASHTPLSSTLSRFRAVKARFGKLAA